MTKALAGIRVLDFGRYIAGPYCAMLLADMGAEVIRIERREGGEDRTIIPISDNGDGALFIGLNRNKKGITLDPAHPLSGEIKRRLIATSDVVIANLPLNVLKKLYLHYEALKEIKPNIILTMISAFGSTGPYANRVGFDSIVQAISGAMSLTGFPNVPVRSAAPFEDYGTALHAAFGTMIALYERERTGQGQLVEGSLLATGMMMMQGLISERSVTGIIREQQGNTAYHAAPSDAYKTKDGWIMVPTVGAGMFAAWAKLVGREDFIEDPRFKDDLARGDNHQPITEAMKNWCRQYTNAEAIAHLEKARIPCGAVNSLEEALNDPQVAARNLINFMDYPGSPNPVPIQETPVRLSATPGEVRHRAPLLGEHTNEVLLELGFEEKEIEEFRNAQVI